VQAQVEPCGHILQEGQEVSGCSVIGFLQKYFYHTPWHGWLGGRRRKRRLAWETGSRGDPVSTRKRAFLTRP